MSYGSHLRLACLFLSSLFYGLVARYKGTIRPETTLVFVIKEQFHNMHRKYVGPIFFDGLGSEAPSFRFPFFLENMLYEYYPFLNLCLLRLLI